MGRDLLTTIPAMHKCKKYFVETMNRLASGFEEYLKNKPETTNEFANYNIPLCIYKPENNMETDNPQNKYDLDLKLVEVKEKILEEFEFWAARTPTDRCPERRRRREFKNRLEYQNHRTIRSKLRQTPHNLRDKVNAALYAQLDTGIVRPSPVNGLHRSKLNLTLVEKNQK